MEKRACYTLDSSEPIRQCAFSHCGKYFAFSDGDEGVSVVRWNKEDVMTGPHVKWTPQDHNLTRLITGSAVNCLTFGCGLRSMIRLPHRLSKLRLASMEMNIRPGGLEDECLLIVGLKSGFIKVYRAGQDGVLLILQDHTRPVTNLSIAGDGSLRLASVSQDGTCKLWDVWDDGNMYRTLFSTRNSNSDTVFPLLSVCWDPFSQLLCITGPKGHVSLHSPSTFEELVRLRGGHFHDVTASEFSADGSLLATSSKDSSVVIWCRHSLRPLRHLWHMGYRPSAIFLGGDNRFSVLGLVFARDGMRLASICEDRMVRLWSLEDTAPQDQLLECTQEPIQPRGTRRHTFCLTAVAYNTDASVLVVGTSDGTLQFYSTTNEDSLSLFNICRSRIRTSISHHLALAAYPPTTHHNFQQLEVSQFDYYPGRQSSSSFPEEQTKEMTGFEPSLQVLPLPRTIKQRIGQVSTPFVLPV